METQQATEPPAGDQCGEVFQQDLENPESPVMQALRLLQLDVDFSRTVLRAAEDLGGQGARQAAAQVVCNLSETRPGADTEQHKRLKLAEESYAWKVSSRPRATSAAYAGGKRHFKVRLPYWQQAVASNKKLTTLLPRQAWCDARQQSTVLTHLKLEEYARFVCLEERIGADKRSPSFKYCAGHILAVRDMRLEQTAAGLIKESEVTTGLPLTRGPSSSFTEASSVAGDRTMETGHCVFVHGCKVRRGEEGASGERAELLYGQAHELRAVVPRDGAGAGARHQALGCSHPFLSGVDVQCSAKVFGHARPPVSFHVCQRLSASHRRRPLGALWRAFVTTVAGDLA